MLSGGYKQVKENGFSLFSWSGFARALGVALGVTFVVFAIGALLLTYSPLPESAIPLIAIGTLVISVLLAGAVSASKVGHHGYLSGAITGTAYTFLLYLVSLLIAGEFRFGSYLFVLLFIGLFGGAAGGILGINLFAKKRR